MSATRLSISSLITVWLVVIIGIRVSDWFETVPIIGSNLGALTAALLVYPPVLVSFRTRDPIRYWQLPNPVESFKWLVIVCLAIFPAAIFINHWYQSLVFQAIYRESGTATLLQYAVIQIVLVAFPEEFFFRGFMQETLMQHWTANGRIFGVLFGKAQVVTAAVFAFSHSLIHLQWWHAFIFFPALIFGWLKEKTGSVWTGTLFHALCNVFAYWISLHYVSAS